MRLSFSLGWIPVLQLAVLALSATAVLPATFRAEGVKPGAIAVIDFRNDDLHGEFASRFVAALRASRVDNVVLFERVKLPIRDGIQEQLARLEASKPTIYYATTTVIAREIRKANPTVPIVFSGIADPRNVGIIRSIDRPENNMTGFISYADVDDKRLEILAALHPSIKRVGLIIHKTPPAEDVEQWNVEFIAELAAKVAAARSRGLVLLPLVVVARTDPRSIATLIRAHRLDALDAPTSPYVREHHETIIRIAREARIPLSFRGGGFVERGGLLSYEPREFDYPVKAASLVAKVLRGTATEDIPIEFPSEFVLSINLTAMSALPFEVNKGVLRRANQFYP
jgi:putative ABC transport system substrate-binding protein